MERELFGQPEIKQPERVERERNYPLITQEESSFIETTSGEYTGYMVDADSRRMFEEFWADNRAYYDPQRREVVVRAIATDAVNDDGTEELVGPTEVRGFDTIMTTESHSRGDLGDPEIIHIQRDNFPGRKVSVSQLRDLAREVHAFLVSNAAKLPASELRAQAEQLLARQGWRKQESPAD